MLCEVMRHIRNFFVVPNAAKEGVFSITDGVIDLPFLLTGQYFLIEGSILNDGVHKYPDILTDETFTGRIVPLAIPKDFIAICDEIEEFQRKSGSASAYVSESFGGYSYTKATNSKGKLASWQDAFGERLNVWRKV